MLPELPDASIETRKPIAALPEFSGLPAEGRMMAERAGLVNGLASDLAGEAVAREREPVEVAQHGDRNMLGTEEFLRNALHFLAGDAFDRGENFVE
jgi:hypothetical protein